MVGLVGPAVLGVVDDAPGEAHVEQPGVYHAVMVAVVVTVTAPQTEPGLELAPVDTDAVEALELELVPAGDAKVLLVWPGPAVPDGLVVDREEEEEEEGGGGGGGGGEEGGKEDPEGGADPPLVPQPVTGLLPGKAVRMP